MEFRINNKFLKKETSPALFRLSISFSLSIILLAFGVMYDTFLFWILIWPTVGVIWAGFFSALHYACHNTLFKKKKTNRRIGSILGAFVSMNYTLYQCFHLEHHRHTNIRGDTEPAGKITTIGNFLYYLLNWNFWWAFFRMQISAFFNKPPYFVRNNKELLNVKIDSFLNISFFICIVLLLFLYTKFTLLLYIIPMQFSWSINFLSSLPEHYGCDHSEDINKSTRTTFSNCVFFQFFYWNSNYHVEHHQHPKVPFFNLPKLNDKKLNNIKYLQPSYYSFYKNTLAEIFNTPNSDSNPTPKNRFSDFKYPINTNFKENKY